MPGHNHVEVYYHFVWATKLREPYLEREIEALVHRYIRTRCADVGAFVYALSGMPDHIHLVCSVPPRVAVAEFIEKIKGASSHFVNHLPENNQRLYWQAGYGVFTFSMKDLASVVEYVDNQKVRHAEGKLWKSVEQFGLEPALRGSQE
jgi:putative transposase